MDDCHPEGRLVNLPDQAPADYRQCSLAFGDKLSPSGGTRTFGSQIDFSGSNLSRGNMLPRPDGIALLHSIRNHPAHRVLAFEPAGGDDMSHCGFQTYECGRSTGKMAESFCFPSCRRPRFACPCGDCRFDWRFLSLSAIQRRTMAGHPRCL
jgi:hypothetical protein